MKVSVIAWIVFQIGEAVFWLEPEEKWFVSMCLKK